MLLEAGHSLHACRFFRHSSMFWDHTPLEYILVPTKHFLNRPREDITYASHLIECTTLEWVHKRPQSDWPWWPVSISDRFLRCNSNCGVMAYSTITHSDIHDNRIFICQATFSSATAHEEMNCEGVNCYIIYQAGGVLVCHALTGVVMHVCVHVCIYNMGMTLPQPCVYKTGNVVMGCLMYTMKYYMFNTVSMCT